MTARRTREVGIVAGSILLVGAMHFSMPTGTHALHVLHVVLGSVSLFPILAGAVWFGLAGGIASSLAVSILYFVHIRLDWAGQPMENVNQAGMIVVYLFVGTASGILVSLQDRERNRRLASEQDAQREAVVQGLASLDRALQSRDGYTLVHSQNVSWLAVELGKKRGLSAESLERLRLAALVHDIGKIGVRDDILLKPGKLTPQETEEMHRHPAVAAEILSAIHGTEEIAEIVLSHHERLDGTGYPRGLKDDEIPLEAKILTVADIYCALTEARRYNQHQSLNPTNALSILQPMARKELDGPTVALLREMIEPRLT